MASEALETKTLGQLLEEPCEEVPWVVRGLIAPGLTVLAGRPKEGKSWAALQATVAVATGSSFMGYFETAQGEALCLFLEDTYNRIKLRLHQVADALEENTEAFDIEAFGGKAHFAVRAELLGSGLPEQLESWMADHPGTTLIVIDTLQKIRGVGGNSDSLYASDYSVGAALKSIADTYGVAIVAIHHTRKMPSDDPFETISGTNGITGAADTSLVLQRKARNKCEAVLHVTGRDVESESYLLEFVDEGCWRCTGVAEETTATSKQAPAVIYQVVDFAKQVKDWEGSSSALLAAMEEPVTSAAQLGKLLRTHADTLEGAGVTYSAWRTKDGRFIRLHAADDGNDGGEAYPSMPS